MWPLLPLGTRSAYGTVVPVVPNVKPVLPGVRLAAGAGQSRGRRQKLHFRAANGENSCEPACYAITGENRESHFGRTWDRRSRNLARRGRHGLGPNEIEDQQEDCRRKNRPRGR